LRVAIKRGWAKFSSPLSAAIGVARRLSARFHSLLHQPSPGRPSFHSLKDGPSGPNGSSSKQTAQRNRHRSRPPHEASVSVGSGEGRVRPCFSAYSAIRLKAGEASAGGERAAGVLNRIDTPRARAGQWWVCGADLGAPRRRFRAHRRQVPAPRSSSAETRAHARGNVPAPCWGPRRRLNRPRWPRRWWGRLRKCQSSRESYGRRRNGTKRRLGGALLEIWPPSAHNPSRGGPCHERGPRPYCGCGENVFRRIPGGRPCARLVPMREGLQARSEIHSRPAS